jgi:hypothetical protein
MERREIAARRTCINRNSVRLLPRREWKRSPAQTLITIRWIRRFRYAFMQLENHMAFKEWAVVCSALASGRQSLILRKGGIHEGRDGFRVAHREFWLFPTGFHQETDSISQDAQPLLKDVLTRQPPTDEIDVQNYVEVEEVIELHDESRLTNLSHFHILSDKTVQSRFHYKNPGLFVILVRVHQLTTHLTIPASPHFAGCRSWVDFPSALSTIALKPVLSDDDHRERLFELRKLLLS